MQLLIELKIQTFYQKLTKGAIVGNNIHYNQEIRKFVWYMYCYIHFKSFIIFSFIDIERRVVSMQEREYLKERGVVTEMQCNLGGTYFYLWKGHS